VLQGVLHPVVAVLAGARAGDDDDVLQVGAIWITNLSTSPGRRDPVVGREAAADATPCSAAVGEAKGASRLV
jgi:hypothetical protein